MRKLSTALVLVLASLLLVGCNQPANNDQKQKATSSEHHENNASSIALNDGEKWKVNAAMKPFIETSETILANYKAEGDKDFHALATRLKEQNSSLIKSCTMQGKSHDELHKWLHPHMELIEALEKAEDPEEADAIVVQLEKSFETYNQFFQ